MSSTDQGPPPAAGPDWAEIQGSAEFTELRRRLRNWVFPMTAAFLVWYLLYVVLSSYAHDFMSTKLWGNINVAIVFGLLQFVSTFVITGLYVRHANRRLDPLSDQIRHDIEGDVTTTVASDSEGGVR